MPTPNVLTERCKGCGLCIEFCPQHCLVMGDMLNTRGVLPAKHQVVDGECTGCRNCVLMCPDLAIEVENNDG